MKAFHLSSHIFISISGIINCINELKSATFLQPLLFQGPPTSSIPARERKNRFKYICYKDLHKDPMNRSILSMKTSASWNSEERKSMLGSSLKSCMDLERPGAARENKLTMMALTMSLLLFFRARIAFARDTLACDMTSSMSLTSTPVSSTYHQKRELVQMCTPVYLSLACATTACYLLLFALLLYCWRLCVFLDAWYSFSLDLELLCRSQLSLLGKIFDLERDKQNINRWSVIWNGFSFKSGPGWGFPQVP